MNYSSRFWLYAPLAVFLALAGAAMVHWWMLAGALEKKLDAINGHPAIPGVIVAFTGRTVSGFPFNLDVVFTGFRISGMGAHGPLAWQSRDFALHALTYGRAQQIYEAAGPQALAWTDAFGKAHHVTFLPGALRASAITDAKGLARFDLDLVAAAGKDSDGADFRAAHAQFHMRRVPGRDDLDTMISVEDAAGGGTTIRSLIDYAGFTHAGTLAPLLAGRASWPDAVMAWRLAGGTKRSVRRNAQPPADATALISKILGALY